MYGFEAMLMIILDSGDRQWAGHYLCWNQGVDHPENKQKSNIKATSISNREKLKNW